MSISPTQPDLLEPAAPVMPGGFAYRPELISPKEEAELIGQFRALPFREFEFHGYFGKRRVVSFGMRYDFADMKMHRVEAIPPFLLPLRDKAASFAGLAPAVLEHALVTEYAPGAAIGWHRDRPVFGDVIGVSFGSACRFRFRRRVPSPSPSMGEGGGGGEFAASRPRSGHRGDHPCPNPPPSRGRAFGWQRAAVMLAPCSAYLLRGAARWDWEHSIPPAEALRYSVTFRTMRAA